MESVKWYKKFICGLIGHDIDIPESCEGYNLRWCHRCKTEVKE